MYNTAIMDFCWQTIFLQYVPIFTIITILIVYKYVTYRYKHWKNLGVPYIDPLPVVGHLADSLLGRKSPAFIIDDHYKHFNGHRFFGIYLLRSPVLIMRDPDLVHSVFTKEFESFQGPLMDRKSFHHDELFSSLINLRGEKWKTIRVKLNPSFTSAKLKSMFSELHVCSDRMIEKMIQLTANDQGIIDINDVSSKFTMDTVSRCAFGINCNTLFDCDSEFQRAGKEIFKPTLKALVIHYLRLLELGVLVDLFRMRYMPGFVYDFFLNLFPRAMAEREGKEEVRNDFVTILNKIRNEEMSKNGNKIELFTDDVTAANSFVFFAGYETTASTMSSCLYELALNPNVQTELREQIQQSIDANDGKLNYETVHDMTYLEMVINEALRMHPTIQGIYRVCTRKFKIPDSDIQLNIGDRVYAPIYSLQNDPKYYPEPHIFDPLRFTKENKASRPHGTFIPFGEGPRFCIGLRFAMMEAKTGLAQIISKFEVLPCKDTKIPIKMNPRSILLLTPKEPIRLLFKKIK